MTKTQTPIQTPPYPAVGTKAPAFSARAADGRAVKLADLKGKTVVLYFYPKDDTPGCTKEACGFRDVHDKLRQAGVIVLGVSPDSVDSHRGFTDKFELPFTLLADEKHTVCEAYGVWQEKNVYGKTEMGVARTTFVIDPQGRIAHVFENVKPEGHEEKVLAWIESAIE